MSDLLELSPADVGAWAPATDPRRVSGREALEQFDAWLVGEMLKHALPEDEDPFVGGGPGGRTYRELWLQEMARVAAREGGFGLSRALAEHVEAEAAPDPDETDEAPPVVEDGREER